MQTWGVFGQPVGQQKSPHEGLPLAVLKLKVDILHPQQKFGGRMESDGINVIKRSDTSLLVGMTHLDGTVCFLEGGLSLWLFSDLQLHFG